MKITILSTSDTHGFVAATDFTQAGDFDAPLGLARAATVIKRERAKAEANGDVVLAIENGDFIQGSPLAAFVAQKRPEFADVWDQLFHEIGYDARVLGNHEFNFGDDYLTRVLDSADVLNANLLNDDGESFFGAPYRIIERQGLKIGVLGLTTEYIPHWEHPENYVKVAEFANPRVMAERYLPELRAQSDVVVIAYHAGFERDLDNGQPTETPRGENRGYELIEQVGGFDALVTGHQHRQLAGVLHDVALTQPGHKGSHVGKITLTIENGEVVDRYAELIPTAPFPADEAVLTLIQQAQALVDTDLDQVIGHLTADASFVDANAARRGNHAYIQLINQIQAETMGVDVAGTSLFNNFLTGFKQEVTKRDVAVNYPYVETLSVLRLTGADLRAALEQTSDYFVLNDAGDVVPNPSYVEPKPQHYNYDLWSGIDYTIDVAQPVGSRITSLQYHGHDLADDEEIDVAMTSFRAVGGGDYHMFTADKILRTDEREVVDVIADYLAAHDVVDVRDAGNIRVINSQRV
ncbi:MAG TPA: bifunctional metallophosphatase/5'-nucleotidase [Lactobacillaceae bacterium]|jgi:2',3'-cyclic-nucleotide 2'-phosphodiesterase/3'-nucleotidase